MCLAKAAKITPHGAKAACPPEGTGKNAAKRAENKLKNRSSAPKKINKKITLDAILKPGPDSKRWTQNSGGQITGYLVNALLAGTESCNCDSKLPEMRDIHMEIVKDPKKTNPENRLIVELTRNFPLLRKKWTIAKLKNLAKKKTKLGITGWMFFDQDHKGESKNTHVAGKKIWRATAWEIHPVTLIK